MQRARHVAVHVANAAEDAERGEGVELVEAVEGQYGHVHAGCYCLRQAGPSTRRKSIRRPTQRHCRPDDELWNDSLNVVDGSHHPLQLFGLLRR